MRIKALVVTMESNNNKEQTAMLTAHKTKAAEKLDSLSQPCTRKTNINSIDNNRQNKR